MSTAEDNLKSVFKNLSHDEIVEATLSSLGRILEADDLLNDVTADITPEEVMWKIAVEHGQSITINILRDSEEPLLVIIPQKNSTVLTLKKAIKHHFELMQKRKKYSDAKISWKYIWRIYTLEHHNQIMTDNNKLLSDYGIHNKSEVKFIKKHKRWR